MIEHETTGWVDRLTHLISRVAMFITVIIVGIMCFEIVSRYFFLRPTLWVNELSLWLGGMIYLLAGLYVMQQRAHIRIFILYDMVPRNVQRVFDVISTALICIFAAAVIWGGYTEALQKFLRWERFGTAWDPPIPATIKPLILITVALMALQALSNLIHDWNKPKQVHEVAEDIPLDILKT